MHDAEASDVFRVINGAQNESPKVTYIKDHQVSQPPSELLEISRESSEQSLSSESLVVYEEF